MSVLWIVRFIEVSTLEKLRRKSFFKNSSGANQTVRLKKVPALENVRFR